MNSLAQQNDLFRSTMILTPRHKVVITEGVSEHPRREDAITEVRLFNSFTADNDPHGEHDFGSFELDGQKFFWKIDYYDLNYEYGADPTDTHAKLLTIMLAEEY